MSDYGNLINASFGTANPALPQTVGNIDENPDKAARALELAKATGVPSSAIYGDLEEFERTNKAQMAAEIVRNNTHLSDFVQSNPMVPKLANDDYGNLDSVSQKTSAMSLPMRVLRGPSALAEVLFPGDPFHRFKEGGPLGSWIGRDDNLIKNHPFTAAAVAGLGTPIELILRGLGGVQDTAADAAANLAGALGAPALGRDIGGMIQSAGMTGRTGLIEHPVFKVADQYFGAKSYLEAGREPPPTVLPEYDTYRAERNQRDVESLSDVVADAQTSLVRERNPDLFRDFIARHTDAEIGISGDAVVALYGDKLPLPDDGLLGWVPGIADQLELARRSGDDISVPIADWVARVDPEMMKVLADDIRVRPGAITTREATLSAEMAAAAEGPRSPPLPEEVPTLRAASALEPLLSVGDRKLKIERLVPESGGKFGMEAGFHDFSLNDQNGQPVGTINLTEQKGGKQLYVEMINGINGLGPRDFGPALMRDLLRQLKEQFPNAESITGHRVSGAREKAGTYMAPSASPVIKLDNPKGWETIENYNEFRRMLEGGQWETFSPRMNAYIKPYAERSFEDRQLINIVTEELDRIVPRKVAIQEADRITATGAKGQVEGQTFEPSGAYIRYAETYPVILYALEGPDPLGTARHEAIHHLRNYGFFKPEEWSVLEQASKEQGWIDQFGIDHRYTKGDEGLKLEESIAEAYKEWEAGRLEAVPEVQTLFERMKAFFDAIKERIGQLLGKEPTWQDIFQSVSVGEVGRREGTQALDARAFDERAQVEDGPNLKPAIMEEDGSIRIGQAGQMHMEIKATNPKESGWIDAEGNFLNREQAIAYLEKHHNRGAEYLEEQAESGKPATLEEMEAYERNATPQDIAYDFYVVVGRNNHTEALKLFDEDISKEMLEADPRYAKAREIIARNAGAIDEALQVTPPEEPSRIFERANALGMTIDQYKRYEKLIEKRNLEDIESATRRITDAQKRVQTKEWKANRALVRQSVVDEINNRPDIAADNYFADGMLYGEKVERVKLGTDFLTEEQRAGLPRDYYNKAGAHPDDLAGLFGFPDGQSLVQRLSGLSEVRRTSGMRPIEFKRRLIDIETDRQMQQKYGVLENNIIDAVKEQVASETQLSLLHEETLYYGMKSGQEPAFDQQAVKRWVADEFEKSSVTSISSDRYLATAGRAGKAVENFLLKQDFEGAFREKQRQYYATLLAKEAIAFEAQAAKFEKLAARLSKRDVKAVEGEYLDFIHGLLLDAGLPVKRSADEIAASKEHHGKESGTNTLAGFVQSKALQGWDLIVSEDLQAGKVKPLDAMTVQEFREFSDAITSLNHVGRAVRKIEIAGEKADWADFRTKIIDNINKLPVRPRESQNRWIYQIDASLTRMEEIAKDLDLRTELGPLHQAVIEPMMRSKAKEFDLMTDLSKHFQETRGDFGKDWRRSLGDTINQDVLHDPYTNTAYDMTRENLIQIMLNWGNRSNIGKFVQGAAMARFGRRLSKEEFPQYEAQIKALIDKHATKQDWDFVQRMWQPFKGWQAEMDTVSRNTSGVTPKWIDIGQVETPHGTFEGGYWPVKYDRLGSNALVVEDRKPAQEGVFGGDYFRAATAKGYLKERTGYVDFVDISTSLEQAAGTMQQTIHDIAFRDALIQGGKVFYDKGIRAAIRKHYGAEYEAQLVPWLRRIAHQFSTDDSSMKGLNDFMRRTRINLVGHALPLNLKVILSPDVGVPNPKAWASYLANRSENQKLAMERSDEIRHLVYNMDRDFRESLDRITLNPNVSDFQKKAVQWGFVPIAKVSQEFRVSTFVDQYYKALGRGKTEQEAALIADSFVRERHGAASVVDLPAVMQSNEGVKMLTMFYGYFNTMYNWQRQLLGNVRRGEAKNFMVNGLGSVVVGAAFGAVLFNQRKEDDSWFKIIAKAMLLQPLGTIPIVRESASFFSEGFQPRTPFASLLGAAGSILTDAKKVWKGERLEKPITHAANVVGLSTGLPLAQIGRTAQFVSDVSTGRQRLTPFHQAPAKNIGEWARGIITGEAKLKR